MASDAAADPPSVAFQPARLVVSPGARLVWTKTDSDSHTVDSATSVWTSEALATGGRLAQHFSSIHPCMHGTIIVQA